MDKLTMEIIEELRSVSTYQGSVNMVVASQIIGSNELYQDGLQLLISSGIVPSIEQARCMGVDATHAIMKAVTTSITSERNTLQSEMNIKVTAARKEKAIAVANIREEMFIALTDLESSKCTYCKSQQIKPKRK
jgi:hypothetical protein